MYYIILIILFIIICSIYVSYKLYNMKDAKSKIMKRIYSDRYHIFAVFIIGIIGFIMNKNKNKYKYIPLVILAFIILETIHVLTWNDQGKFISSDASLI